MHPAGSVILFSTSTGFGYGLVIWQAMWLNDLILRNLPLDDSIYQPALYVIITAFLLITTGLCASTFHLGRPERAWRAMSQWRTSWLSREGLLAVITYIPIILLGLSLYLEIDDYITLLCAFVIIGSLATVYCTAMIYASLKPIAAWHNQWTIIGYLVHAIGTGGILFGLLAQIYFDGFFPYIILIGILAIALFNKIVYWFVISQPTQTNQQTATGLKGKVRQLDPPHSSANYLMKEMGFQLARKYSLFLRPFTLITAYLIPLVCIILQANTAGYTIATISIIIGIISERYLFFAEAKHTVQLYYQ